MSRPLFCYYGDDFTGSTDALEVLAIAGVPSVLLLDPPAGALPERFSACRAIGIAGESRSRAPAWMSEHLPGVFHAMRRLGAPLCQYKVCSTFDSSPEYGSIGRALDIGRAVFETPYVPVVAAAPHLGRYVLFGNLFAAGGGAIHRIDRHPTMRHHPVTPMSESDLRLHLARQTESRILLLDILALHNGNADTQLNHLLAQDPQAILFDGLDEASLRETGRLLWQRRTAQCSFAIGSSGLTQALILHWREAGVISPAPALTPPSTVDRLVVVSGSCSPVTEGQIHWAAANGFPALRVQPAAVEDSTLRHDLLESALNALPSSRGVILYTALGPKDCGGHPSGAELGAFLGGLLRDLLLRSGVRRAVVAGGDTSTHAVRRLGIHALTFLARLAPGSPLCLAHSDEPAMDGLELVLKGGQVGPENFFEMVQGET